MQIIDREKISVGHISDEGLISRIHKNAYNSVTM